MCLQTIGRSFSITITKKKIKTSHLNEIEVLVFSLNAVTKIYLPFIRSLLKMLITQPSSHFKKFLNAQYKIVSNYRFVQKNEIQLKTRLKCILRAKVRHIVYNYK